MEVKITHLDQVKFAIHSRSHSIICDQPTENGGADSGMTPPELAAKFAAVRKNNLKLLTGLTPKDLTRTAIHAELGKVTLGELINEWIGHDLNHTVQAERAMMQPFIASSGPWRSYFQDHDIKFHEHMK